MNVGGTAGGRSATAAGAQNVPCAGYQNVATAGGREVPGKHRMELRPRRRSNAAGREQRVGATWKVLVSPATTVLRLIATLMTEGSLHPATAADWMVRLADGLAAEVEACNPARREGTHAEDQAFGTSTSGASAALPIANTYAGFQSSHASENYDKHYLEISSLEHRVALATSSATSYRMLVTILRLFVSDPPERAGPQVQTFARRIEQVHRQGSQALVTAVAAEATRPGTRMPHAKRAEAVLMAHLLAHPDLEVAPPSFIQRAIMGMKADRAPGYMFRFSSSFGLQVMCSLLIEDSKQLPESATQRPLRNESAALDHWDHSDYSSDDVDDFYIPPQASRRPKRLVFRTERARRGSSTRSSGRTAAASASLSVALLPAAALAARPSTGASAAASGADFSVPRGVPLRICDTVEAAAEAVDLTLLAFRGPFGTPLNRGLEAYGRDLELLLPAKGPDNLLARLGAVRHSLAPTGVTFVMGLATCRRIRDGNRISRVRFGCGACEACQDPLAQEPCLRPLTALIATKRITTGPPFQRALRAALGWDPAATYSRAAAVASERASNVCSGGKRKSWTVSACEEQEAQLQDGTGAVRGEDAMRAKRPRLDDFRQAAVRTLGNKPTKPYGRPPPQPCFGGKRNLKVDFITGPMDGEVVVQQGGHRKGCYDGLVLDGEHFDRSALFGPSYFPLAVAIWGARLAELQLNEQLEMQKRLKFVSSAYTKSAFKSSSALLGHGYKFSSVPRWLSPKKRPLYIAGDPRLLGWEGMLRPNEKVMQEQLLAKQTQERLSVAQAVKAADQHVVDTANATACCRWCGHSGHRYCRSCPLRSLCSPPLDVLVHRNRRSELQDLPLQAHSAAVNAPPPGAPPPQLRPPEEPLLFLPTGLLPQNHTLPPGFPRAKHYYSTALEQGGGEPSCDDVSSRGVLQRTTQGAEAEAYGAVGKLPSHHGKAHCSTAGGPSSSASPDVDVLLSCVSADTLELMAALDQAYDWASGMQPGQQAVAEPVWQSCERDTGLGDLTARQARQADGAPGKTAPAATEVSKVVHLRRCASSYLGTEELLFLALLLEESIKEAE